MSPKWKFILIYGEAWGLFMFVSMTTLHAVRKHSIDWVDIMVNLLIWPLGGLVWGSSMWAWRQRQLNKKN